MPILGIIDSAKTGRLSTSSFEFIATTGNLNGVSSVTFSSGLSAYTHLVVRYYQANSNGNYIHFRLNGDSGAAYDYKQMYFDGSNFLCDSGGNATQLTGGVSKSGDFGQGEAYFLDINSTTKNKSFLDFGGNASAGAFIATNGGAWRSTSAVTSVTALLTTGTWQTGSRVSLYGIKGS